MHATLKRLVSLLTVSSLTVAFIPSVFAADGLNHHNVNLYRAKAETAEKAEFWTKDDDPYVQYVDVNILSQLYPDKGYKFYGNTLTSDEGGIYVFDAENDTIKIESPVFVTNLIWEGRLPLVHDNGAVNTVKSETIALRDYDIIKDGGKILLPVPVLSTFFAETTYDLLFSDNQSLYFCYLPDLTSLLGDRLLELSGSVMGRSYSSDNKEDADITEANYNAICLRFDTGYGFRDRWQQGFDAYLTENYPEVKEKLLSGNGGKYCSGLYDIMLLVTDDNHTSVYKMPVYTFSMQPDNIEFQDYINEFINQLKPYENAEEIYPTARVTKYISDSRKYNTLRSEVLPDANNTVRYYGDMAVITWDSFDMDEDFWASYKLGDEITSEDTIGLLYRAFEDIQKHPEVNKVVYDISNNGGGIADAVIAAMGFMKHDFYVCLKSSMTGAVREENYSLDTNCDGVIDGSDSLEGKYNFYILESEASFSCGNLLPLIAKEQDAATIIGKKSSGGACPVVGMVDLYGSAMKYSGAWVIHTRDKNGNLISADDGVIPDYELDEDVFYDDAKLLAAINEIEKPTPSDDEYATREYVISEFVKAAGNITDSGSLDGFKDSDEISESCKSDVARAVSASIVYGYEDNTLRPKSSIRRIEALAMLSRCLPYLESSGTPLFFTDIPAWAKDDVDRLSGAGLVYGYGDGKLGSDDNITVGQVKKLTERITAANE